MSDIKSYLPSPCPDCGGPVAVRSNRSRYCSTCYYQRYGRTGTCPACQGKMRASSEYCSTCARPARPPRVMSDPEVAWVAGILEGEGSFSKTRARIHVTMTDRDVVEKLHNTTGIGSVFYDRPGQLPHHKPYSTWYVTRSAHVVQLAVLVIPWLGIRRRSAALSLVSRYAPQAGVEPA
jgi:hypothetical protein